MSRGRVWGSRSAGALACLLFSLLAVLGIGCSSDEFGPMGSSLPSDVRQDSLLIPLDIVGTLEEVRLELPRLDPPQGSSIEERQFLYFGTLAATDWRATPFLRFQFSNPDTLDTQFLRSNPDRIKAIRFLYQLGRWDAEQGPALEIGVYLLNAPLDRSMAEGPASSHLGNKIGDYTVTRTLSVNLLEGLSAEDSLGLKYLLLDWIEAEDHDGIALSDNAADSSLVAIASEGFDLSRNGRLLFKQSSTQNPEVRPRLQIAYLPEGAEDLEGEVVELSFPSYSDLTVFDRGATPGTLALGAQIPVRTWFDFDLDSLPRAATINGADLVLHLDRSALAATGFPGTEVPFDSGESDPDLVDRSDGDRTFQDSSLAPVTKQAVVYEATREEAQRLDTSGLAQVRDALGSFRPDFVVSGTQEDDDVLRINITDYVQRVVNRIFGSDPPGLLLVGLEEQIEFYELVFFDSSAADSLKPRLEIRFTPPADFEP